MSLSPHKIFKNPIIEEQSRNSEAAFVFDSYLGHKMPEGRDFIGERDYLTMEQAIQEIKARNKKVVINLGDSSTSGWDSNAVTKNRERFKKGLPLIPPFFQYKTYSDYLKEKIGNDFVVLNAGVPAYTSLQGLRRLKLLIECFKKEKITIDYLTIYYGNNDSVWNLNREEKDWLEFARSKKRSIKNLSKKKNEIVIRVSADDYGKNIKALVSYCRHNKIIPILIKPLTPIYWKPGTRVKNEELPRKTGSAGSVPVYKSLDEALNLWREAIKQKNSDFKKMILEEIREKDFIVPRIKKGHLEKLRQIAKKEKVTFIDIELDTSQDDIRYFIDYCHPIGQANKFIAQGLAKEIKQFDQGTKKDKRLRTKKYLKQVAAPQQSDKAAENSFALPTEHYTLY